MVAFTHIQASLLPSVNSDRAVLSVLLVSQFLAIALSFAPLHTQSPWVMLAFLSVVIHSITLFTLASFRFVAERWPTEKIVPQVILILSLIALFTALFSYLSHSLFEIEQYSMLEFCARTLLIALIFGLLFCQFVLMHLEKQLVDTARITAELDALQARIRPHFLFNSLNISAELVHQDSNEAEAVLLNLAELSRAAIQIDDKVGLEKELELVKSYLAIEKWRFGERLVLDWQLPETLPSVLLPSLTLQPLVENAVCHGLANSQQATKITIQLVETSQTVTLSIENPVSSSTTQHGKGNGIALENIRSRLVLLYGERAKLACFPKGTSYFVKLVIPKS
jgi:two-component system sensor histidine kinase AlgZ